MASAGPARLAYIDWMRGLACVLMFQTHCYDAWLREDARHGALLEWSQKLGTFPAPLFLFLAGISFALVVTKLRRKGLEASAIARTTIRRGAEIFALGILFRVQEFAISWGWAPWSDLFRVDILNTIGLSMMLMGGMCWLVCRPYGTRSGEAPTPDSGPGLINAAVADLNPDTPTDRPVSDSYGTACAIWAALVAMAIALLTPPLWTTWRIHWLPWPIESYINGVHNLGVPQPWLFPVFPWTAFAFAGLAVGFILQSDWARERAAATVALVGLGGVAIALGAGLVDSTSVRIYAVYDFWHTSPNFFLIRLGIVMVMMLGAYAWCRWGLGHWGFSPLIQLGKTSLLVYWVHIEFVYGRFTILPHRGVSAATATLGLLLICLAMLALSLARTWMSGPGVELWRSFRFINTVISHPSRKLRD